MNYRYLPIFTLVFLIFSCQANSEKQAQEYILQAIDAHELDGNWDKVSAVKFKKHTRFLDEKGTVESEMEQWVEFRLKPYFEGRLSWEKDSISHVANFNGSKMSYQMGENEIQNQGFLKSKRAEIHAAFCAFGQPWRLLDENVHPAFEGQKVLSDGQTVDAIRVYFIPDSDVWWFYFDPESKSIIGYEKHTENQNSLVENVSYQEAAGLNLVHKQKVYKVDEVGRKLFLQAEYQYSDYQVTYE
ncbi:hypothetical protein PBT90_04735 [Algoriphagus halophytocola]|uniref:Uncharacterized protein n=1 Tax=Algoriphagus halophytocola TaxID=2991499 RepID=A0ABY6MFY6_9BACT|nr:MULTISPECIES: hypothetical protein [unclassified Algoriphagus]UZD22725.1 hypothetical protein OM944_18995 [Algoriphagus sp. TR-M5]WBL43990.1 hypothetical protein PBT90_04735 [Algoriphagus sp. TR-M9]